MPAAGAVLVAINTRLSRDEVALHPRALRGADGVRRSRARAPGRGRGPADDPHRRHRRARTTRTRTSSPAARPSASSSRLADEEQTISINYTSGTTGRPKGVMYTPPRRLSERAGGGARVAPAPESVQLWVVPMFHCNGWCFTWAVTAMGARHVCLRKVDPAAIWELLDREGVTHYNGGAHGPPRRRHPPRRASRRARAHRHDRRRPAVARPCWRGWSR